MNSFVQKILDEPVIDSPWAHQIVHSAIESDLFEKIKQQCQSLLALPVESLLQIYLDDFKNYNLTIAPELSALSKDILRNYNKIVKKYPYHRQSLWWKRIDTHISVTPPLPYTPSDIHCEASDKILSIVVYIAPFKNKGTMLYNSEKSLDKTIPWKENTSLIFCGKDNTTWHSYASDYTNRITLNFFIRY
jgi:hypothetical protein